MTSLVVFLLLLGVFGEVLSVQKPRICKRLPNHTTANRTVGDNGYSILVEGLPISGIYVPGETYSVVVKNTDTHKIQDKILGIMLVAVPEGDVEETKSAGKFFVPTDHLEEAKGCGTSVITHIYMDRKDEVRVNWKAPAEGGCVEFRATVVSEIPTRWFKDDGGLTIKICHEDPAVINEQGDVPARETKECCACGEARYKMVFQGLWSKQTHPKGFPTKNNALLLHWSNIVGATHTEDYHIWEYGGYAERGVREVCEYGHSTKLEKNMKENSDKIYTVIKTSPMWRNVQGRKEAVFKVNQKAHLLSLLTMIGPSPDWCIGVPSLSVCNENCTWADEMIVDLFPWDAGTDDGVEYINRGRSPTDPPERIHRITNMYPKHPSSPFFGGPPIKPFARLTLTKLKEVCGTDGSSSGEDGVPSTEDLINMMKQKMMLNKKLEMMKCATSDWTEWTECSNSCGTGIRKRDRRLVNENVLPSMCNDLSLTEEEQCQGKCMNNRPGKTGREKLSDNFEVRHTYEIDLDDPCAITPWSDWSPCTAKLCGRGVRERWRMFLREEAQHANCRLQIMEPDICYGIMPDCRKALMLKNFTAICSLPMNRGPCRGDFERWHYSSSMRKCIPFRYGGCRGNENRFDSEDECRQTCADYMDNIDATFNVIDRGEVTHVSDMDLKRLMMKKQMMSPNLTPQLDGTDVNFSMKKKRKMMKKARLMEKEKRRERKRQMRERKRRMKAEKMRMRKANMTMTIGDAVDCMVTDWTPWEECTEKCGKQYITRTRMIKRASENGGKRCPKKLTRKRKCKLPKCPRDCKVSPWSEWSACTATCGTDVVKERKRSIMKKPRNGGMDCPSLMERQSCSLPPCNDEKMMKDFMEKMQKHPPF